MPGPFWQILSNTFILVFASFILIVFVTVNFTWGEEWKTYVESGRFAIDYPASNGSVNITEIDRQPLITTPNFSIFVIHYSGVDLDPQSMAYESKSEEVTNNKVKISDVSPIMADGEVGYFYIVADPTQNTNVVNLYFNPINNFYQIEIEGLVYDKASMDFI